MLCHFYNKEFMCTRTNLTVSWIEKFIFAHSCSWVNNSKKKVGLEQTPLDVYCYDNFINTIAEIFYSVTVSLSVLL